MTIFGILSNFLSFRLLFFPSRFFSFSPSLSLYLSLSSLSLSLSVCPYMYKYIHIYIHICIQGSLNKFPYIFRMDTFIDCTHMKLYSRQCIPVLVKSLIRKCIIRFTKRLRRKKKRVMLLTSNTHFQKNHKNFCNQNLDTTVVFLPRPLPYSDLKTKFCLVKPTS